MLLWLLFILLTGARVILVWLVISFDLGDLLKWENSLELFPVSDVYRHPECGFGKGIFNLPDDFTEGFDDQAKVPRISKEPFSGSNLPLPLRQCLVAQSSLEQLPSPWVVKVVGFLEKCHFICCLADPFSLCKIPTYGRLCSSFLMGMLSWPCYWALTASNKKVESKCDFLPVPSKVILLFWIISL